MRKDKRIRKGREQQNKEKQGRHRSEKCEGEAGGEDKSLDKGPKENEKCSLGSVCKVYWIR